MHTQTNIQDTILKNDLNLGIIRLGGNAFSDGLGQDTFNRGMLVSGIGGSGDPRRKWEEMGERERERERWGKRECVEMCCLCLQNDLKEA